MIWAFLAMAAAAAQQPLASHASTPRPAVAAVVATVNGTPLTRDRLDAAVRTLLPYESFHKNLSPAKLVDVRNRALTEIVEDELQYQEARRLGLSVSDADIEKMLGDAASRYPSRQAFVDALAKEGATLADIRQEIRRALLIRRAFDLRVTQRCGVTTADAQAFYAANPTRFVEPERLHVQAITIGVDPSGGAKAWAAGRSRADEVRRLLEGGASFETLARQYSTDATASRGGDMGLVHRGSLTPEFEAALATLPAGAVSPVIETLYGYHLVRVTETQPARPRSFDDVAPRLQRDLATERCESTRQAWVRTLRDAATITYAP